MPQVQPSETASTFLTTLDPTPAKFPHTLSDNVEVAGLDDASATRLLAAEDPESIAQLATWLKAHARTFAPIVLQAAREERGLSAESAAAVLDAAVWRTPADGDTTLKLIRACLGVIATRITQSLREGPPGVVSDRDDPLVRSAVAVLTSSRPSRHSETAIDCLAQSGPGGAVVLARAFDAVRSGLKVRIVRCLKPVEVLELGDNVVASLALSVSKLAETLEGPEKTDANRLLTELGSVQRMEPSMIDATELLRSGDRVFHASWGAGVVVAATDEKVTIDFGSAGTRTLLRALTSLRREA